MVSAPERRALVPTIVSRGISIRRACALVGVPRSTLGYVATQPLKDAPVMPRIDSAMPRPTIRNADAQGTAVRGCARTQRIAGEGLD